jgi:hypothetical protein
MKEKRIQFSKIVKSQLPNYVVEEFPLISEFLSQYYISQEFKGAPTDLIQNIDNYIKIDEMTRQTDSVVLGQNISFFDTTIFIDQTGVGIKEFPNSYGILQIDDEIITYTGKTSNSFTGCIRGFSAITSLSKQNYPDELIFTESESQDHTTGAEIKNLSSLFLKEFLIKIKYQLLPGFQNRTINSNINENIFIKQAKNFYLSKGTDESFKILFNVLYGETADVIRPKDYLLRPSDANYDVTEDLVVEKIEGDPLNLKYATLFQNEYRGIIQYTYSSISNVEIINSTSGDTYYKLSFDSNYANDVGTPAAKGNFSVHAKTKVIGEYTSKYFVVTAISNPGTPPPNHVYVIDGDVQKELTLEKGRTYKFDTSNSSNVGHPFIFQTLLGSPLPSTYYSVLINGISGESGSFVDLTIALNAPNEKIKYNCSNHNGMGSEINISTESANLVQIIDVDSTVGFPNSGELYVTYKDGTSGNILYSSKNINQFIGCYGVTGVIADKSNVGINTYAYANVKNELIKVRINSVISSCSISSATRYYGENQPIKIKTLGVDVDNYLFNSWILNIAASYEISSIRLENTFDNTYNVVVKTPHIFKIGDSATIISSSGVENLSYIVNVISSNSFTISSQGFLSNNNYTIKKNLSKANSNTYKNISNINSNVQNLYKLNDLLLVASQSIPTYKNQSLDPYNKSITFSGSFPSSGIGSTNIFKITTTNDHGFYTGDIVYYTPEIKKSINQDTLETQNVVISSLFEEGIYYVRRIDKNNIQFANSKDNIYYSNFKYVDNAKSISNNKIEFYNFKSKSILPQKLLRFVSNPIDNGKTYETNPGFTGILINGVEILNYKSSDFVYYGKLKNIKVISSGNGYDIITPPDLIISDNVGYGATGYCAVKGGLSRIKIINPGFDYQDIPVVRITGGNGVGAICEVTTKLIEHEISFNSQSSHVGLGSTISTIGFGTYHKFRNSERVIYKTNGQTSVGGLSTNSSYYIFTVSPYTIKLHQTVDDAISGINTVVLSSYGIGNHNLQSYNKKSIVGSINVINSGSGYENKKRTSQPLGINTSSNSIKIENHDYKSGEIVVYNVDGTSIGGITTNTSYYVTTINNDEFRLSQFGLEPIDQDFYYKTKQFVGFNSVGFGTHFFNYPEIGVKILGTVGISSIGSETFECVVKPIFEGEISSVHLSNNGIGYGSSEILNYNRHPNITLNVGSNLQLTPIIQNGKIIDAIINNPGKNYSPNTIIDVVGDGSEASLTPIIQNGQIISIKVINGGNNYNQQSTSILVTSPGSNAKFYPEIQTWRVDLFKKSFNNILDDDGIISNSINENYQLQYCHLYAPRKLRELIYSTDQNGSILYGIPDFIKNNNQEKLSTKHSPIIGWAYDGNPIYGPYGYVSKQGGIISPMKSGYELDVSSLEQRPNFPLGFFVEDYKYSSKSDETFLDENNGRFCITPEYPNGTYAYFSTINADSIDNSGVFKNCRRPIFPYLIGNYFKCVPNKFNFEISSNQDTLDLNNSTWMRFTTPYNINNGTASYSYLNVPNNLNQKSNIEYVSKGSINNIEIDNGGDGYKINDPVDFELNGEGGFGAAAKVSIIKGKPVTLVSTATSTIDNVEFFHNEKNSFTMYSENPHNFNNTDIISVSGLNTTSISLQSNLYSIGVVSSILMLNTGIGSVATTGIVTYFNVMGDLSLKSIRENDIFVISTEKIKILNVDQFNSRIRVLREINNTVGISHTATETLYEIPRKLKIVSEIAENYNSNSKLNYQIYFNPSDSIGLGTISGVGIGTTLTISNPGAGITQIFIPTKTIYIPNHKLETGDILTYSANIGSSIGVSTNGISTSTILTDQSNIFVAKISEDLIGISNVKVGLGSTGVFVGIASTTNSLSTLYFTGIGTGVHHSFKTNYDSIFGNISRNLVTVSTSQTHGLTTGDFVNISINPSISTTFNVKYNEYNRRLVINSKDFISVGVSTNTNSISITNHGFINGQKIIHSSISPCGGLQHDKIYYIVYVDNNTFKLSNTEYGAISSIKEIVSITSPSIGTISPINPPIKLYKNSIVTFDISDPSLSYVKQFKKYPAFEFKFYKDSNFNQEFNTSKVSKIFDVKRVGIVGVDINAKAILNVNEDIPKKLYYNLIPVYDNNIPQIKKEIIIDNLVQDYNEIDIKSSMYNGEHKISISSITSFNYNLPTFPESVSYASSISTINYETTSLSAFGAITKFEITNFGNNYYTLPGITSIFSDFGSNAIVNSSSNNIGIINTIKISDIGFNFPSDITIKPSAYLPQILKLDKLSSFSSIEIVSIGKGYISAPKLIVIDQLTKNVIPEVDLTYSLGDTEVTILNNTFSISNSLPIILPTENTNGVGINSITFNDVTKIVTVQLATQFSAIDNLFDFNVGDKVLIENVNSNGKGYNSKNYNYNLFTLTSVTPNFGGIAQVSYSLSEFLDELENPGTYDPINSSGRIIAQKHFPIFNSILKKADFLNDENIFKFVKNEYVILNEGYKVGKILKWDSANNLLTLSSNTNFNPGDIVGGKTTSTKAIVISVESADAFFQTGAKSKVEHGWRTNAGFLNDDQQKIQDSFYYQNFSYSIKSKVDYSTWNDSVSTINHTLGYLKFSDYQLESFVSKENIDQLKVGISTNLSNTDILIDNINEVNLNCIYNFDLVKENYLKIENTSFSNEIIFSSKILTDYSESVGNRVLNIDDISSQFNSLERLTRFSDIHSFNLSDARVQKYFVYVKDQRYTDERQCEFVTIVHNNLYGFINQYAKTFSVVDLGFFDFSISQNNGKLRFYPKKYELNDYSAAIISYDMLDTLSGISSANYGGIVNIVGTSVSSVSAGSTCTIVSIANTYTSAKILVEISGNNGEYQFEELNIIHDGSNINILQYGELSNSLNPSYSISGLGTYNSYFNGSNLIVDFIPNSGLAVTCNTLNISIANTSYTGIGTFDMKHSLLEARTTSIASSTSPIATPIGQYININSDNFDYDCAHFLVQVSDPVNNHHQLSEVIVLHNSTDVIFNEFANLETASGLGTVGVSRTDTFTKITFTPNVNIEVQVKTFMNALQISDDISNIQKIDFTNSSIVTNSGRYQGTQNAIKRDFDLKYNGNPIFRVEFTANDPFIVDLQSSSIKLPNHFFVTGEELVYSQLSGGIGLNTHEPIGIATTSFVAIGSTNKIPSRIYAVKTSDSTIKLSSSAENALKLPPKTLEFTSLGIGSDHAFNSINQSAKIIVSIDNLIQSPIVSTEITSSLLSDLLVSEDIAHFTGITSFFGGDLIKINDEIMKVDGVSIGSTNGISLKRPWLGTTAVSHLSGSLIKKLTGTFNIVDNTINFIEAPYGNIPRSDPSNSPNEIDWIGMSSSSSFHGRVFLRSGISNSVNETYYKNYIFDNIYENFDSVNNIFTLTSNQSNIDGIINENAIILVNDIFQGPGLNANYTLLENSGITSVSFIGTASSVSDANASTLPRGGIIEFVGSINGFGYQPLVSAGATATVSIAGTISAISIGNSGSGYRAQSSYKIFTDTSYPVGIGSTIIYLSNNNSIFSILNLLNTGSNCVIGVGTFIEIDSTIVSVGSTFIKVGTAVTSQYSIPAGTKAIVKISDPQVGIVNINVNNSYIGISTIVHVGYSTIISGKISSSVIITNPGIGYTSTNQPKVIIDSPLSYSDIPLIYSSSSNSQTGSGAIANIVVGQGSSVIDFEIVNFGSGYAQNQILTVGIGQTVGIPTIGSGSFSEFQLSIQKTYNDNFSGWSIGELQVIDNFDILFDGQRTIFPIMESGNLFSILSSVESQVNVQDVLIIFINDILQIPGSGYIFNGGSNITFSEAPKLGDTSKIIFYKGSGSIDVVSRSILESIKEGDDLTITGQKLILQEKERKIDSIKSTNSVITLPYFGPGNTNDSNLLRPVVWCKQTEDKIINGKIISKDRSLYEPLIYPFAYLIKSVGIESSIIYVDNVRPFFNPINENNVSLNFQNNIELISQDSKVGAVATSIVSSGGTISSIVISDGGVGYTTTPVVLISQPIGFGTTSTENTALAVATISGGILTGISVTFGGGGYISTIPPQVFIQPPIFVYENNSVSSYEGDFGIISGISTISVGVASTGLVFDLLIPPNSVLRNSLITGITTISGIQTGYYFIIYDSNVGNGVTSLNSSGLTVGIGTTFLDNVYQVSAVSIAQTSTIGFGNTYVAKVIVSVSNYNGLSGIGYSNFYGQFSWGKINLSSRSKENSYNAYTNNGIIGILTGSIAVRKNSLKYLNYIS